MEQVLRDDKANAAPRVTAAAKVWEIVNRAHELGDIESRLTELERIAGSSFFNQLAMEADSATEFLV